MRQFDAVSNLQRLYPIKWPPDEIYFCVLILWLPQYLASLKIFVNIDVENILSSTANLINSFTVWFQYSLYTRRFVIELYLYTFCWFPWSVFIWIYGILYCCPKDIFVLSLALTTVQKAINNIYEREKIKVMRIEENNTYIP